MRSTIDKAGRIVIPALIRERARLAPGTEVEITLDDLCVRLVPLVAGPRLIKQDDRWVVRPSVTRAALPELDPAELVDEERNRWPV